MCTTYGRVPTTASMQDGQQSQRPIKPLTAQRFSMDAGVFTDLSSGPSQSGLAKLTGGTLGTVDQGAERLTAAASVTTGVVAARSALC